MFNFNEAQNQAQPNLNNYCGGYALTAILRTAPDVNNLGNAYVEAIDIYQAIQHNQQQDYQENEQVQNVLHGHVLNGTLYSLPSAIARVAGERGLNPSVLYNEELFNDDMRQLMMLEVNTLGNHNIQVQPNPSSLSAILNNNNIHYAEILVANGEHWIAIERTIDNGGNIELCAYDSAGDGWNELVLINENTIIGQNINHNWSGIIINVA